MIYEPIDIDRVLADTEKKFFNSNNHWKDGVPPDDYNDFLMKFQTKHWITKFKNNYKVVVVDDPCIIRWMKECELTSCQTGLFSNLYSEELSDSLPYFQDKEYLLTVDNPRGSFIRTDTVSLKHGQHKVGPYSSWKAIIQSTCSSVRGHSAILQTDIQVTYYIIPWVNLDKFREFRVFIHNFDITCISQQSVYDCYPHSLEFLSNDVERIVHYFNETLKGKLLELDYSDTSIDIVVLEGNSVYVIEFNPFGVEYAAGSALFHWIIDRDILYSTEKEITVRYTRREEV